MAKEALDGALKVHHETLVVGLGVLQRGSKTFEHVNLGRAQSRVLEAALPVGLGINVKTEAVEDETVKDESVFGDTGISDRTEVVRGICMHAVVKKVKKESSASENMAYTRHKKRTLSVQEDP